MPGWSIKNHYVNYNFDTDRIKKGAKYPSKYLRIKT